MWTAKITFDGSTALIGSKTQKHKINILVFPLSYSYEKNSIIVHITGNILGKEENIKNFVKEFKKEKRVINFELNDNFFIGTIKEPIKTKNMYNKNLIHLAPTLIDENSQEHIIIGSFNKKFLEKAIKTLKKYGKVKLNYIKEKKIKNISIIQQHPELTSKQKQAIELAIKHGYYKYPRKIELKKLAKLMKISYSTYQAHLRKAEQKLLPFFFEKIK